MREVRYRAWDKRAREYREVTDLGWDKFSGELCTVGTVNPKTGHDYACEVAEHFELEPYTGDKDDDGVEIAVGDIVSMSGAGEGPVVFKLGAFGIEVDGSFYPFYEGRLSGEPENLVIVGNIHWGKADACSS